VYGYGRFNPEVVVAIAVTAYSRFMNRLDAPPVLDLQFLVIYLGEGLGVALAHIAGQHDLEDDEVRAVQVTIEGLILVYP
jgi:hypothetical protein